MSTAKEESSPGLEGVSDELRQFEEERERWEQERDNLKDVIRDQADKYSMFEEEKAELVALAEDLMSQIADVEAENRILKSRTEWSSPGRDQERHQLVVDALLAEKEKTSRWQEDKEAMTSDLAALKKANEDLKAAASVAELAVEEVAWAQERSELLDALAEEKDMHSTWEEETEKLDAMLQEAKAALLQVQEKNGHLQKQLNDSSWQQERNGLQAELEVLQADVAAEEAAMAMLREQEAAQKQAESDILRLREELERQKTTELEQIQVIDALRAQIKKVKATTSGSEGSKDEELPAAPELVEELETLRVRFGETEEKLKESRAREEVSKKTIECLEMESEALRQQPGLATLPSTALMKGLSNADPLSRMTPGATGTMRGTALVGPGFGLTPIRTKSGGSSLRPAVSPLNPDQAMDDFIASHPPGCAATLSSPFRVGIQPPQKPGASDHEAEPEQAAELSGLAVKMAPPAEQGQFWDISTLS